MGVILISSKSYLFYYRRCTSEAFTFLVRWMTPVYGRYFTLSLEELPMTNGHYLSNSHHLSHPASLMQCNWKNIFYSNTFKRNEITVVFLYKRCDGFGRKIKYHALQTLGYSWMGMYFLSMRFISCVKFLWIDCNTIMIYNRRRTKIECNQSPVYAIITVGYAMTATLIQGYPSKKALSAMRKHGG